MFKPLYAFIWRASARGQVILCLLTLLVVPLSMVPLELQRRILEDALGRREMSTLIWLAAAYLAVMLVQGGLKYVLNVQRGRVVEEVVRRVRLGIYAASLAPRPEDADPDEPPPERGALVSMVAAEAESLGGFVGESVSIPLLQAGTVAVVLGYLVWVQPLIASFAIVVLLPQAIVVPWVQQTINRLARRHAKLVRKLGDHIVKPQPGAQADARLRRFRWLADASYSVRMAIYRIKFLLTALGNFLDALGPLGVLFVGGIVVLYGRADIPTLLVFISGFQRVVDPWDQLVNFYRTAANAAVNYRLIVDTVGARALETPPLAPAAARA